MSEMGSVAMWAALNNRPKSKLNLNCVVYWVYLHSRILLKHFCFTTCLHFKDDKVGYFCECVCVTVLNF